MLKRKRIIFLFAAAFFFACSDLAAFSMQTIINVPSSETLPQGDIILKDSNVLSPNDFARITPSVIVGVGKGMEFSGGVATNMSDKNIVRADLGIKKVFFLTNNIRLTAGGRISPYLNQNGEPDSFVYSHFSHRIKKTKTTLTAGVYVSSRQECLPSKTGALLGVEQVVIPNKLSLAFDYYSREDQFGSFAAGFKCRPIPTLSVTSAVVVMPEDDNRVALSVSVSKFFSVKKQTRQKEGL